MEEDSELDNPARRLLGQQASSSQGPGSSTQSIGRFRGDGRDSDSPGPMSLNESSQVPLQPQSRSQAGSYLASSSGEGHSAGAPVLEDGTTGRVHAAGQSEVRGEGEVIDTLGKEIAAIVTPVTICMSLVVCLVLLLTPNGAADGSIVPVVGALVYQEKR